MLNRKRDMTNYKPRLEPVKRITFSNRSWIVQRLNKPTKTLNPYGNTIDFDDKDSIDRVAKVFSTDYMGAFEYEHGALGESMSRMYENDFTNIEEYCHYHKEGIDFRCYVVYTINIDWKIGKIKNQRQFVEQCIQKNYIDGSNGGEEVAKNDYGSFYKRVNGEWDSEELMGWYDLRNDFAWFLELEDAENFKSLFD